MHPKRVPFLQDFTKQFLDWLDKTTLEQKTKDDYRNGNRLILQSRCAVFGWIRQLRMTWKLPNFTNRRTAGIVPFGRYAECWARPATGS